MRTNFSEHRGRTDKGAVSQADAQHQVHQFPSGVHLISVLQPSVLGECHSPSAGLGLLMAAKAAPSHLWCEM